MRVTTNTRKFRDKGMGKLLVFVGLGIALVGLAIILGVPLGRLPGDIHVRRGNFSVYFPVTTCVVLSIILTLLLSLFRLKG